MHWSVIASTLERTGHDIPLIPLDPGSADEAAQLLGQGATGQRDGEFALLLDGLLLRLQDELREGVDERVWVGEGTEDRRGRLVWHDLCFWDVCLR